MTFEQVEYSVSEAIDEENLALLVCVLSTDVPLQFEVQLSIESQTATGRQKFNAQINVR